MKDLKATIQTATNKLAVSDKEDLDQRMEDLISLYPFNEYEFAITNLVGLNAMSRIEYINLREEYISRNLYLYIFEISAPRSFGESWAQDHLKELVPDLTKPTGKIDQEYSGEYDFSLLNNGENIKIEVKASRAVDSNSSEPLYVKALSSDDDKPFWMNFQQIKPRCAQVFVFVAVWRDTIKYWIFSSQELESNPGYSRGQHRGNTGEGQLHIRKDNMKLFDEYLVTSDKLKDGILAAYKRSVS